MAATTRRVVLDASRLPEVTSASSEDTSSVDEDGDCKDRDLFCLHVTRIRSRKRRATDVQIASDKFFRKEGG